MSISVPSAAPPVPAAAIDVTPPTDRGALLRPVLVALSAAAIFGLALLPRVGALDVYVTADEGNWVERTALFSTALARGDAAGTFLTGHPGVMTMWAGLLGMGFERGAYLTQNLAAGFIGSDQPAYFDALVRARFPLMLLTCLATMAVALLAWRLFGRRVGLLAGVLLALEPFWIAHSLVLHLDAAMTSFMTVSMLAALIFWWRRARWGFLLLSAACAGLTVISKTPGVFILLFVPFAAGLALLADAERRFRPNAWLRLIGNLALWAVVAFAAMLIVWPALRVDPPGTLVRMLTFTEETGGSEHENFFLNDSTGAPGALYYPITLALRVSPVTQFGLLIAAVALVLHLGRRGTRRLGAPLMLVAYCALFVAMMDLAPKKFDRYLLALYPVMAILAAAGFIWATARFRELARGRGRLGLALSLGMLALVVGLQLWQSAGTRPYYMAYYNPLWGGAPVARNTIVVGWGEGMDIVARQLASLPDADSVTVATFYNSVFASQFPGNIMSPNAYQPVSADYALLYVNVSQRSIADRLRSAIRERDPYMTVRINGLEYVTVYKIDDQDVGAAVPAEFGQVLRLERYRVQDAASQPGTFTQALMRWRLVGTPPASLVTSLDLVRTDGWVAARQVVPLSPLRPLAEWRRDEETVLSYGFIVPTDLPTGRYRLIASVTDPASGQHLAVSREPERRLESPAGYQNGVVIATVQRD